MMNPWPSQCRASAWSLSTAGSAVCSSCNLASQGSKNFFVVFTQIRSRQANPAGSPAELHRKPQHAYRATPRVLDLNLHFLGLDLRIGEYLGQILHLAAGHA